MTKRLITSSIFRCKRLVSPMIMEVMSDRSSTPQNGEEAKEAVEEATHQSNSLKSSTSSPDYKRREEK
jgi:hypothetical protein